MLSHLLALCSVVGAAKSQPPHIVYYLVDDLGYSSIGYNSPTGEPKTPYIDGLRAEGAALDRFYTYKFCSPTRSSFLSGRLPLHVNQQNRPVSTPGGGVSANMTTVAEVLRKGAYRTHHIGKWHAGMSRPQKLPINRGFDSSLGMLGGAQDHYTYERLGQPDLWRDHGPAYGETGTYSAFLFTNEALRIISEHDASGPLFLYMAFELVHAPRQAPERFLNLYDKSIFENRRLGLAMISAVDESVANITESLKSRGMYDNTLIIFSSDNGGDVHHEPNFPLRGAKGADFDGGVRVVAFVSGGWLPAQMRGGNIPALMHIADLYATFASLAGVDPTDQRAAVAGLPPIDSIDMTRVLMGEVVESPRTELAIGAGAPKSDGSPKPSALIWTTGGKHWKLIRGVQQNAFFPGVTTPNGTKEVFPESFVCNDGCMFDLSDDEEEHIDVTGDHLLRQSKMMSRLQEFDDSIFQEDGAWNEDPAAITTANEKYGGFWGPWEEDLPIAVVEEAVVV